MKTNETKLTSRITWADVVMGTMDAVCSLWFWSGMLGFIVGVATMLCK